MSNGPDWADEKARTLCFYNGGYWVLVDRVSPDPIAAALRAAERRGRVAGMREAAEIVALMAEQEIGNSAREDALWLAEQTLVRHSDELEKQ